MAGIRSFLRAIGSLWFAAALLVLWAVAMACATVFESRYGSERALGMFYYREWFKLLLALVGVNVLAAMVVRLPFSGRQVGFVITHAGILTTLVGALVTTVWGVDGRIGVSEGQTVDHFTVDRDVLVVTERGSQTRSTLDLTDPAFRGFEVADRPRAGVIELDGARIQVERFLPDSEWSRRVHDDNAEPSPAVEVALIASGQPESAWVFDGQTETIHDLEVAFQVADSREELDRLVAPPARTVRIEYQERSLEIPLTECLEKEVPIADSPYRLHVMRYLPSARVGSDGKLTNVSDRPENPAIEAEVVGPEGRQRRIAFARLPDLDAMHGRSETRDVRLVLVVPDSEPLAPIEVLGGPDGETYVRFSESGTEPVTRKAELGSPMQTPWDETQLTILRRFDHAGSEWAAQPVLPVRETRVPAIAVRITEGNRSRVVWLQKFDPRTHTIGGRLHELAYRQKTRPLGFRLTLNDFRMPLYPGERRPRSFESHITLREGGEPSEKRVISMNRPVTYAGYTLYQSSYGFSEGSATSFLSVSHDPGRRVVFTGYIATLVGMLVVLATRVRDRRHVARAQATGKLA